MNSRADELLRRNRAPIAEICFVLDEKSVAHFTLDHKEFLERVYKASISWRHTGAPFDMVLLDDLLENRCRSYRLIVPACVKTKQAVDRLRLWLRDSAAAVWWDETAEWYSPSDSGALIKRMAEAGVHRYVSDGSTAWANASMVLVHANDPGTRQLSFREPCQGFEFFSRRPFEAPSGACDWVFQRYETALFLIEE